MGIFSNAFKAVQTKAQAIVGPKVSANIVKTANTALAVLTTPIKAIQNLPKATEAASKASTASLVTKGALNAAVVVAPFSSAVRSAVVAVAPKLIPSSLTGKVAAVVAAPVIVGAVANNPFKAGETAVKTTTGLVNVGSNLMELGANPSVENLKNLVTENPVLVGGAAVLGAAITAKTIIPAIVGLGQTGAIKEQTDAIKDATAGLATGIPAANTYSAPTALTPQTAPLTSGTREVTTAKKRAASARKKKAASGNVTQKVNIVFDNDKIDNKKYLKGARH